MQFAILLLLLIFQDRFFDYLKSIQLKGKIVYVDFKEKMSIRRSKIVHIKTKFT